MHYQVSEIIKNEKYPNWIRNCPIFRDISSYTKIFPKIGLENNQSPLDKLLAESCAIDFLKDIIDSPITKPESQSETTEALCRFFARFKSTDYIDIDRNRKITLLLSEDVPADSGKIVYRKGRRLFSLLEDAAERGLCENLLDLDSFKDFGRLNIPTTSAQICFSTDPWDLATMSMRGISTCQSWTGEWKQKLIGSIVDPYVGMIFLSSGKSTDFGSKMLYRGIVRFAVEKNSDGNKPVIIIDHIYPEAFPEIEELFTEYLTTKSGLKTILATKIKDEIHFGGYYFPKNSFRDSLSFYQEDDRSPVPLHIDDTIESYQNNTISVKSDTLSGFARSAMRTVANQSFRNLLLDNISTAGIELASFPPHKIGVLLALKNRKLAFENQIKFSIQVFCNSLFYDIDQSLDSRSYKIKLYLDYFNRRKKILETISSQVIKWNSAFLLKNPSSLSKQDFQLIMQQTMLLADQSLKEELKRIMRSNP